MSFIVTATGKKFDFERPEEFAFEVDDIAPALSNLCRFVGQLGWWSVAQHSMLVADLVAPEHRLRALLHDASEAFLADIPGPLKKLPRMWEYRRLEARVENAIFKTFGAPTDPVATNEVKRADLIALRAEAAEFGALSPAWDVYSLPAVEIPSELMLASRFEVSRWFGRAIREEMTRA